jgi:hypothetical protein
MLRKSFVCIGMWIMLMGAVVVPQSLSMPCTTPPSGMVSWWPGDNTPDDIVSGNNGTLQGGATYTAGKVGPAFRFAAAADFVNVPDPVDGSLDFGTGPFSIDAWIKTTNTGTATIVDKRDSTVTHPRGYVLSVLYGKLAFQLGDGGIFVGNFVSTSPVINDDHWHHVAVTVDRSVNGGNLYVDGANVLNFNPTVVTGSISNDADLRIGQRHLSSPEAFAGAIDEVEIFNRVLDPLEVWSIFQADSAGKCKPVVRNHYKTWRIQPQTFDITVFVQDQFMDDSIRLIRREFLSNPVKKVVQNDTFNIIRPNDHLTWYGAFGRDTLIAVEYVNQFESTTVKIDSVKYLLLPTAKESYPFPESLDHYKAYRIRDPVAFDAPTLLEDQFDSLYGSPEFIYLLKPLYFLTPALKNMPPPMFDSITHYVAYEIFPKRFFPIPVNTFDQFGSHVLQVDTSKFLLVPAKKIGFGPPPESLYWKPPYPDYAPSGMPDISQKQDNWMKLGTGQWTFSGPVAVANCFKWFDSKYNVPPGVPGDGIDMFPLVRDYLDENPPLVWFDDHDPWNVDHVNTSWNPPAIPPPPSTPQPFVPGPQPPNQVPSWGELVERLAWYFNTDGIQTGYCAFSGTKVNQMEDGISQWFLSEHFPNGSTLADTLCEVTLKAPTFAKVESLVKKCEDVILLLGFWWHDGTRWRRSGGHYVTVAGVNSGQLQIAFSDPFFDNAEMGGAGRVGNGTIIPHAPGHYPTMHNDEGNVSHDIYDVTGSPSPGGVWGLPGYPVSLIPAYSDSFSGQNTPDEFLPDTGTWNGVGSIYTEVEYAVHISPWDYRGDVTGDSVGDASDIVYLLNYLFVGGPAPDPYSEGDANCDGIIDIADVVFLLNYLFINGPEPRCCDP